MTQSNSNTHRIFALMLGAALIFSALIGRLYFLQVIDAPEMRQKSQKARTYVYKIPASRGYILDRHGKPLALNSNSEKYTVSFDKVKFHKSGLTDEDLPAIVQKAGQFLEIKQEDIDRHVSFLKTKQSRDIRRGISDAEKSALEKEVLPGLVIRPEPVRVYPEGTLAAHVIGYTGSDCKGLSGLEYALNDKLEGEDIRITGEKDVVQNPIVDEDITKSFRRGADIVLTLDSYIQHIVEREIKRICLETEALQVNAVVMHPKSGEILAMANYPVFDPNIYSASPEHTKNSLLTDTFEPGSVMKPFTVIAALDRGVVTPETIFYCENGGFYFRGHTIRDDIHSFGDLTVHDILVRSSNIGTVKIALKLGEDFKQQAQALHDYYRRFGFKHWGDPKTSDLPGESVGTLFPPNQWQPANIGAVPFGQGIATNTLVLTTAYSAIANRGLYIRPHIIKEYRNKEGYRITAPERPLATRIVSKEVVEKVVDMLVDVTEDPEGTGYKHVRIPGYRIAGKTGTAQKVDPAIGTYGRGMRISSFAGFFPAEDPEVCIVVVVNEPRGRLKYGGETAGAAWKRISEDLIAYWGLSPSVIADATAIPGEEAKKAKPKIKKTEDVLLASQPKTFGVNQIKPLPSLTGLDPVQDRMPNLEGLTVRDAYITLTLNGLRAEFQGSGKVVKQGVAPGTVLDGTVDVGPLVCEPVLTDPSVALPPPEGQQVVQAETKKASTGLKSFKQ